MITVDMAKRAERLRNRIHRIETQCLDCSDVLGRFACDEECQAETQGNLAILRGQLKEIRAEVGK